MSRESRADQYGFDFKTLKNEGKHVANNVRSDYPADRAGLRDGDFILEVNGESIDSIEHDSVVNKISAQPTQVDLLVVADLNAYLASRPQPIVPAVVPAAIFNKLPAQVDVEIEAVEPVLAVAKKDGKNLKFKKLYLKMVFINHRDKLTSFLEISRHDVKLIPGFSGLGIGLTANAVISSVDANSPSELAGLKKDSKIVEVNGVVVRDLSNKEIAKLIKENENNLQIGVVKMAPKIEPRPAVSTTDLSRPVATGAEDLKASRTDLSSVSSQKISGNFFD